MKEYIAQKKFHCGEIVTDIIAQERIQFDGVNVLLRGEKKKAPSLMAAVRNGWLQEATVDASGKQIVAAGSANNIETPSQRAARLKAERMNQIRGSAGNGQFVEDLDMKKADKVIPKVHAEPKVVQRDNVDVKTNKEERSEKKKKEAQKKDQEKKAKAVKREIISETEGVEVAKVSQSSVEEDADPKSFYEAMMEGEVKKLGVQKDQFVPAKRDVIKMDSQDDAVEVKKLVNADEVTASTDPLKNWTSMTVKKKEAFLKKATDSAVVEQIVNRETGAVKRKAEEKLQALKSK